MRDRLPAFPVLFTHRVFEEHDGVARHPIGESFRFGGLVGLEVPGAPVLPHFAGRRIEANGDVRTWCIARFLESPGRLPRST